MSIESSGGKWFVYDHAFREIKAGPFDTRSDAKAAYAVIKSRARYTTSPRYHAKLGFKTKYPGGQKPHNPGVGRGFIFFGSATSKLAARKLEAKHPGSFIHEKDGRFYILKAKKRGSSGARVHGRSNPGVPIYGQLLRIEAKKTWAHTYGGKKTQGGQKYFHDFSTKGAMIYGLPDGSLLIKAKKN